MIFSGKKPYLYLCIIILMVFLVTSVTAARDNVLHILSWPGYAEPDIVRTFEQRFQAKVVVTYVNSDDELWSKLNSKSDHFDVFAVNAAELQRYIRQDLSTPINMENIPNHNNQLSRFQNLEKISGLVHDEQVYAIPYTYSEMGLIYDKNKVTAVPRSMTALWDPQYRGRVLAYNTSSHNFSMVALTMGAEPFNLDEDEFKQAVDSLIALRRNVLAFYTSPEEAVKLYQENDIALIYGNYGSQQVKQLQAVGADVGYIIPEEGALAWLDCWALKNTVKNKQLAEQWINYTLEKKVSDSLTQRQGLSNTVTLAGKADDDDKIIWLEPLENYSLRKELWYKIRSGDTSEVY
ncbi:MAG: extracellular solute-binding protein [Gammaproteobacteria bacterium]|nr:extracellular solute-binding protein [Gammaproteobacteria bacterium]